MKNAKYVSVYAHARDQFASILLDANKNIVGRYDGYVPESFGRGDDVELPIEIETGKIVDWKFKEEDRNLYEEYHGKKK